MRRWLALIVKILFIFFSAVVFVTVLCMLAYLIGMAIIQFFIWLLDKLLKWCSG